MSVSKVKKQKSLRRTNTLTAYLFMTPTIFYLIFWTLLPIAISFVLSFTNYDILKHDLFHPIKSGIAFMGLDNYSMALQNDIFWRSITQTVKFAFFSVVIYNILGLIYALTANNAKGKSFFRFSFFIPNVTSVAALVIIFDALFRSGTFVTEFLALFGIPMVTWRTTPGYAMNLAIIMSIWVNAGYCMLIYLAGLQEISPELYEAADIDGASPGQKFMKITFPLLNNKTFFLMATGFIGALQVYDILQMLSETGETMLVGGPEGTLWSAVYYIYYVGWSQSKMGRASAISFLLLLLIMLITLIQRKLFKDQTY